MHWGYLIFSVYAIFGVLILLMVYGSSKQTVDLVADDYYAQEMAYQKKIDAGRNTALRDINLTQTVNDVVVSWPLHARPQSPAKIVCYRPSASHGDFMLEVEADTHIIHIPKNKFMRGKNILQVTWTAGGRQHYYQEEIFIP